MTLISRNLPKEKRATNMPTFHYHFLETNKELTAIADSMREIFNATADIVTILTEEVETDIVVRHSPQNTISEFVFLDNTQKTHNVLIFI